jgi:V/A-type H+-transporting ATPase subunit B
MSKVSFKTLSKIAGPLIFVEGIKNAAYGEMVEIKLANDEIRQGQVLDTREGLAIVQVFGSTIGLGTTGTGSAAVTKSGVSRSEWNLAPQRAIVP